MKIERIFTNEGIYMIDRDKLPIGVLSYEDFKNSIVETVLLF